MKAPEDTFTSLIDGAELFYQHEVDLGNVRHGDFNAVPDQCINTERLRK